MSAQEDDSNVSMAELGTIIASFFGTPFEFHNFLTNVIAGVSDHLSAYDPY